MLPENQQRFLPLGEYPLKKNGDQYPTIQYVTQSGKGSKIRALKPDIWRHLPSGKD